MEDRHDIQQNADFFYASVFDGHSGDDVAAYLRQNFYLTLNRIYNQVGCPQFPGIRGDVMYVLPLTFSIINDEMKKLNLYAGSTAAVAFIIPYENFAQLYTAHAGDSRIVDSNGNALTTDHTPKNSAEVCRIGKNNIFQNRLGGRLAVTRAFGDFDLEEFGLTSKPEVHSYTIKPSEFIIIASDGIWDVVSNQAAANFVKERLHAGISACRAARELILYAAYKSMQQFKPYLLKDWPDIITHEQYKNLSDQDIYNDALFPYAKYTHDNQTVVIIQLS
jgi:serine/threonine protein phosphatase PrpC